MPHSCSSAVGKLPQNQRNTDTSLSATLHFIFMLIFPAGNFVHKNTRLPVPVPVIDVIDAVLYVCDLWSCAVLFCFLIYKK